MKFWFSPRHSEHSGHEESVVATDESGGGRLRTLIVTTDEELGSHLVGELEKRGHAAEICTTLEGCTTTARRRHPDLSLVDWRLDSVFRDGTVSSFREANSGDRCTVLALVERASDEAGQWRRVLEQGADDILQLPLEPEALDLRLSVAEQQILRRMLRPAHTEPSGIHVVVEPNEEAASIMWQWVPDTDEIEFFGTWENWADDSKAAPPSTGKQWLQSIHQDDREQLHYLLQGLVAGERRDLEHCVRMPRADGTVRHVLIQAETLESRERKVSRVEGQQTDISDTGGLGLRSGAHLLLDPLTRLASRPVLMDRLRHAFARAARPSGKPFALLFFDLDRFKHVNDGLGHVAGDQLLFAIAERVKSVCRPSDTICRFGGDEFVIVAEDVESVRQATTIADRLHREFSVPFLVEGNEVYASISTGIVMWKADYTKPEDMLRDADNAMHRAKGKGRNRYSVFDENMHAEVVATLALENDLRRAVARREFRTYYQPIVSLGTGRLVGFEALVRWQHPERGLLLPGAFIAVAEEMGVAVQLDRIVAEEACRQLRAWEVKYRPDPPLTMSINISTTQFLQPDLVPHIDRTLRQNGLYGSSLKLEVTESVLMENTAHASAMLDQLRAFDISISIDDFGTGYSSLAYLRRFEIDTLKIDFTFVSRMLEDEGCAEIVRAISNLAQNLGKDTVAEGVETRSQLEALRHFNVDRIQGFFVAPPLPPDEVERMLELIRYEDNHLEAILFDRAHGGTGTPERS